MMAQNSKKNPWMGLESYSEGEVLYGRDDDIRDLSQCVLHDNETLLYGKSGIGKSSILNAGILPSARRHGFVPVIIRLSHKPQDNYFDQIAAAVGQALGGNVQEVVPRHRPDGESLYEYFHRHKFYSTDGERAKLLIIFDQFEEIFTLQSTETVKKHFFAELADLLNNVVPAELQREAIQPAEHQEVVTVTDTTNLDDILGGIDLGGIDDAPEYVTDNETHFVFTIREDFISEFEYYTSAIPSFKRNRYGLRPINEEQAAQIILRPVPGLISRDVARLIIEKVTGRTDFELDGLPEIEVDSAVLSLYLNRLYEASGGNTITARLVEQKGGEIIADFYADAISGISDSTVEYLENMLLNGQGRRDNITIYDAINEGHATSAELDTLCNQKKILRQFNYAGDLRIEYIHDILCPVVKAHKDARDLAKQQEAERQRLVLERVRERRRFKRVFIWSASIISLILGTWLFVWYWNQMEYSVYYPSFTRQNGWPIGVGEELSEAQAHSRAVSYRLVRKGRNPKRHFTYVEVCSSDKHVYLPNFRSPLVGKDEQNDQRAAAFSKLNRRVRLIRFAAENDASSSRVSREQYYDENSNLLYAINYYHSLDQDSLLAGQVSFVWAVYVNNEGLPLRVRDNGADRMKVFYGNSDDAKLDKLEVKYMFYDEQASPQMNDLGCYGFRVVYRPDRTVDSLFHLDPFTFEELVEVRDYSGNQTTSAFSPVGSPRLVNHPVLGYARRQEIEDEKGNVTETRFFGADGHLLQNGARAIELCHYDVHNRVDSITYCDADRRPVGYRVLKYNGFDNVYSQEYRYALSADGRMGLTYMQSHQVKGGVTDNVVDDRIGGHYRHERIVTDNARQVTEYSYLDRGGHLVFDSLMQCSRYTMRTSKSGVGTVCVKHFYGQDGQLSRGEGVVAVDSTYYDSSRRCQVTFDADGRVVKSMGYEYKDGVEVTRYALSLDGHTPIRCPEWEIDGLCYYRLNTVKNARTDFNLAYIQAVSEYPGCASFVYFPDMPKAAQYEFDPVQNSLGGDWTRLTSTTVSIPPVAAGARQVQYVHITQMPGSAHRAGLRDGDLLLDKRSAGGQSRVSVLRYHRDRQRWERLSDIVIPVVDSGMEVYPVAYTEEEYSQYLKALNSL